MFSCMVADNFRCRAKYPLAIVAKVLEVIGEKTCGGYDIGCSFLATLLASCLGADFQRLQSKICVNAFHGYSHNFACQSVHHPNVVCGIGIEDLETMERIFSSSNQVAAVTRYASAYNRRVFIDMFFKQWDDEKYQNLGTMLFNNYRQALNAVSETAAYLKEHMALTGASEDDIVLWGNQQQQYFLTVGTEPEELSRDVVYVDLLESLERASYVPLQSRVVLAY